MPADQHTPLLDRFYLRYLDDEDSAAFISATSKHYLISTLERLALFGNRLTRRGAVLALSFVGSYESTPVMGQALKDHDRLVRVLAENGIRELWCRDGSDTQRQQLGIVLRLNNTLRYLEALEAATLLIDQAPALAEVWNQRAIAHFQLRHYEDAANDCQQTLDLNPYHFGAAVGMAHCYLETGEAFAALECFRRAVEVNPNLEAVRDQIDFLERALEET